MSGRFWIPVGGEQVQTCYDFHMPPYSFVVKFTATLRIRASLCQMLEAGEVRLRPDELLRDAAQRYSQMS